MDDTTTADALAASIDREELIDNLTGRDGGLRPSKPRAYDGLTQYVWRMARFHGGWNTSMPITCTWWLQDYLDENDYDAKVTGMLDEDGKAVLDVLEAVTDAVLLEFGENPARAAQVWQKAGAF